MIRKTTIAKFIDRLTSLVSLKTQADRIAFFKDNKLPSNYITSTFSNIYNNYQEGNIDQETYDKIVNLLSQYFLSFDQFKDTSLVGHKESVEADKGSDIEFIRDENGKINEYAFKINRQGKEPLVGKLTRDDANTIYRLYSYYGASITQREISRYFPEWSLIDFKRILRAFNITKASAPFAPHVIEEYSTNDLLEMQIREKENDFLRRLEASRIKMAESLLNKCALENLNLKQQIADSKEIISSIDFTNAPHIYCPDIQTSDKTLIIWLSDMHIGAAVSGYSIYQNQYDNAVVRERLSKIVDTVSNLGYTFKEIIVCNLGDSLDGMDHQTSRRDHYLPQNMTNKEQVQNFMNLMIFFINSLSKYTSSLKYYCVGESNHDGDLGYVTNLALAAYLNSMGENIAATVFNKFIGHFKSNNMHFVLCHGKDNKDMFKNLPLVMNDKTENFINEYLDTESLYGKIVFVKGDLHQSATTYAKRFTYKSVGSLFGSSEWIHKNFGNTKAACDYSIVDTNGNILDGRVVLQ